MFKYLLLNRLRDKGAIFWSMIFPLALMICFKVAFGNLTTVEIFETMEMTVIREGADEDYGQAFEEFVEELTQSDDFDEDALFHTNTYSTRKEVEDALLEGKLELAYIVQDDYIEVLLPEAYSDAACAAGRTVADTFMNNYEMIKTAFEENPAEAMEIVESLGESLDFLVPAESNFIDESPNPYLWYYYSTLVMGILFNALSGVDMVAKLKADVDYYAMRISVSPKKKASLIFTGYGVYLTIALIINFIQIALMKEVFEIPMGNNPLKLILLVIACNIFSIAFGTFCGCLMKGNPESRSNKVTSIIMVSSFLSGEMICVLPGFIESKIPLLNDINPATVMNMALFRLAYSAKTMDYYSNLIKIVALAVICLIISIMILRREKYASL